MRIQAVAADRIAEAVTREIEVSGDVRGILSGIQKCDRLLHQRKRSGSRVIRFTVRRRGLKTQWTAHVALRVSVPACATWI